MESLNQVYRVREPSKSFENVSNAKQAMRELNFYFLTVRTLAYRTYKNFHKYHICKVSLKCTGIVNIIVSSMSGEYVE